jgi:hypothetical protein
MSVARVFDRNSSSRSTPFARRLPMLCSAPATFMLDATSHTSKTCRIRGSPAAQTDRPYARPAIETVRPGDIVARRRISFSAVGSFNLA